MGSVRIWSVSFHWLIFTLLNNIFSVPPVIPTNGSMIMSHELERMWKEVIMVYVKVSIPVLARRNLWKPRKTSIRIVSLPGLLGLEINITGDLQNENNCTWKWIRNKLYLIFKMSYIKFNVFIVIIWIILGQSAL
jgi:hypothetical protein